MTKNFQNYNPFGPDPRLIGANGWVYIIKNDAFSKKLHKIGATTRTPEDRVRELNNKSNEGTPGTFYLVYKCKTCDCGRAERDAHEELDGFRKDKEWFKIEEDIAKDSISKHCLKYDRKAEEEKRKQEKEKKRGKKAGQRRGKEKEERRAKKQAKKRAARELEKRRKKVAREAEEDEREEAARKKQRLILWGITLGVVSFVSWRYWSQIIWTMKLLFFLSLAAVLLYFAWAYLRDNILTDEPKKDERRKWGYCHKCGVFFDGGFCVDCTQSDNPDPNKLV